jgi:phage baseplate assembly protein W
MSVQVTGSGKPIYTDIDPFFNKSPKTGDLLLVRDELAIRTSLKNLMSTAYGERLFQPQIGGSLRQLLFEPIDSISAMELRDRILLTIANHEPRVRNVIVDVVAVPDSNAYSVTVEYSIRALGKTDRVTTVLERVR